MDLHAGHAISHRGGPVVREPDRGDADQHQLLLEAAGLDGSGEHASGRDEACRIAPREVDPHAAVALGRDARGRRCRWPPRRSPTRTENAGVPLATRSISGPRPGTSRLARRGDQRHAANDAGVQIHAHEPVAGGGVVDLAHAPEQGGPVPHERNGIGTDDAHGSEPAGRDCGRVGRTLQARHAEHDRASLKRLAPGSCSLLGRRESQLGEVTVEAGQQGGQRARREPVSLWHEDIDPDRGRIGGGDPRDELRPGACAARATGRDGPGSRRRSRR